MPDYRNTTSGMAQCPSPVVHKLQVVSVKHCYFEQIEATGDNNYTVK